MSKLRTFIEMISAQSSRPMFYFIVLLSLVDLTQDYTSLGEALP